MKALRRRAEIGTVVLMLLQQPALALDTMEAIGAEKCGRRAKTYEIEFLAPENATLEARAKVVAKGTNDLFAAVALALDGKECTEGRCGLQAKKGQSYRLSASTKLSSPDELCIVVARP